MADGSYRSSRAVSIVLALLAALPAAADEPAPQEIAELVAQLDSDDFDTREMAVPRLIAVGRPAIGAVGKAALGGSSEARFRAVAVLSALSRDKDEATSDAAHQVLLKIAAGNDAAAARQAEEALVPFRQLDKMRQLAEAFAIFSSEDGKPKDRLPLRPRPVQRFVDKERYVTDGTLWTLGGSGRPQVVIEVYPVSYNKMEEQWYSAVASLTTKSLVAEKVDGVEGQNWTPGSWEQEFMPVPKVPPPAEGELQRGIAMSQIARRLSAHQFWPPGRNRHELEVVAEPVLRYQDQQTGILDGGLFVIVHETNPEVLLLIEAQTIKNTPRWMYAFAPMGSAAMHVQLDDEEVWTSLNPPNLAGGGTHPYWAFTRKPPQEGK